MAFAKIHLGVRTQGAGTSIDFNRQMNVSTVSNPLDGVTLIASQTSTTLVTMATLSTNSTTGVFIYNLSAAGTVVASAAFVHIHMSGMSGLTSGQKLGLGKGILMWPQSAIGIRAACNSGASYYVQWGRFTGM